MAKTSQHVNFESFLDGLCDLWQLDESRNPVLLQSGIRFQNRVIGFKRNFAADQAGRTVQKLIRIPQNPLVKKGTFVVIGQEQYTVLQAQNIPDTIPRCTDLTLEQPDVLLEFDAGEAGAGGRV